MAIARTGAQLYSQGKDPESDRYTASGIVGIKEEGQLIRVPGQTEMTSRKVNVLRIGETGVVTKAPLEKVFGW